MFLQSDAAFDSIAELGEIERCEFRDLHPDLTAYQRKFVHEVRRCEDMERKLRVFRDEIETSTIKIPDVFTKIPPPTQKELPELEAVFEKLDEELEQINTSTKDLKANYERLREMKSVLTKVRLLLDEGTRAAAYQSISEQQQYNANYQLRPNGLKSDDYVKTESELKFVAGTIKRDKVPAFERVLWRLARGKVYVRAYDYVNDNTYFPDEEEKSVFMLFMSGDQLKNKVTKVCEAFRARIVDVPETEAQRAELAVSVNTQLEDMSTVVNRTLSHRDVVLNRAALKQREWEIRVLKLKAVFHILNFFDMDVTQKCLIGECWIPTADIPEVQHALRLATHKSGSTVPAILHQLETSEMPPTFHKVNKFTRGFQNIVDSYGIADYREVNPGPWTIITFPFIFALMFGDAGHGLIMFLSALLLVVFEKKIERAKIRDEIFNTFFGGRYIILLMGMFSIYTGLIYNDIYSRSVDIFGSSWINPYKIANLTDWVEIEFKLNNNEKYLVDLPSKPGFKHSDGPYPFGVDPIWNIAENKLNFLNAMKMKSSVIIGVSQMCFGLTLSLFNHLHKGSFLDVFFVFLPQCLFLGLIFVYLCIQIIIKWIFFYVEPKEVFGWYYPGTNCAPNLLIGFISMFMMKSRKEGYTSIISNCTSGPTVDCHAQLDQCDQQLWYPHQDIIEKIFLFVAVLAIPVMLLVKPFVLRSRHNRGIHVEVHGDSHEFNFGDVIVYQAIHTIEFALGCVSHTASYLRLWALSLAHAQLSEVLWTMVLRIALQMKGITGAVAIFIIFSIFAVLSICILILMEGLSAFLHALRLHWVEFQSKFYGGNGIQFEPFSFEKLIRISEGLDQ